MMMANMLGNIKENDLLKSELCKKDGSYSWCKERGGRI